MSRWHNTRWSRGCNAGSAGAAPSAPAALAVDLVPLVQPQTLELGAELVSPTFNALVTGGNPLVTKTLTDDDGNPAQDILGVVDPIAMPFTYTENAVLAARTFTLFADDGTNTDNDVETYTWIPRVYHGIAAIPGAINEAFIEGLAENELRSDKGITRSGLTWTAGEYVWWAIPQAFNPTVATDFLITQGGAGFPGGVLLVSAGVSVTPNTANGVPILYDVWRSTGAGNAPSALIDTAVTP